MHIRYAVIICILNILHELKYFAINCAWVKKYKKLGPLSKTNYQDHP